jgi:hypothetical protein
LGLGLVASMLIAHQLDYRLQDVIFCLGILLLIIGMLLSMKGSPSGNSISSIGNKNTNAISYFDLEVTRQERESNPYHKDFMQNNIIEFSHLSLIFLLAGIFMIAFDMIFY